jgi:hypothetical protein
MGHNNDYSVTVFFPSGEAKKWKYVHRLDGFSNHLNNKHSNWLYMNVYDGRKRQFLKRFYKDNIIPDFI